MTKIIISGGGTGGHIFPAIAVADALKVIDASIDILFVGAENRMEMECVPAAGYPIAGLPVAGLKRRSVLKNVDAAAKLMQSILRASKIIASFKPCAALGVGGYASFPALFAAQIKGIPTIIAEQNSYAGKSNKWLARRAVRVCTAYAGMERFFPKHKILLTGNPIRQDLQCVAALRSEAASHFGLDEGKKTILALGGSLGARSINNSIAAALPLIAQNPHVQWIWQSGRGYYERCAAALAHSGLANVKLVPFVERMGYALAAADLVISRAGAGAAAELAVAAKPCILVPSPNVAEDHQTKNAQTLQSQNAAVMIPDCQCAALLVARALEIVRDDAQLQTLSNSISAFAMPNAAYDIAKAVLQIIKPPRHFC